MGSYCSRSLCRRSIHLREALFVLDSPPVVSFNKTCQKRGRFVLLVGLYGRLWSEYLLSVLVSLDRGMILGSE